MMVDQIITAHEMLRNSRKTKRTTRKTTILLTAGTRTEATKNMLNCNWRGVESKITIDDGKKV